MLQDPAVLGGLLQEADFAVLVAAVEAVVLGKQRVGAYGAWEQEAAAAAAAAAEVARIGG